MNIDALFVYPIKSCAGIAVDEARVTARGLEHDRRWMVVDAEGRFLSQRELPEMALVKVAIAGERFVVSRDGMPRLPLPFLHDEGARVDVVVWDDRVRAVRHEEGSAWFARALGVDAQLVCMPDDTRRAVEREHARDGDIVSFADGFPLLVVNRASLEALGAEAGAPVDVRRFRPNVVIAGAAPWAEDDWRTLAAGAVAGGAVVGGAVVGGAVAPGAVAPGALTLRTPKPCARCSIPGVDPDSAATTKEPLRTLAKLRTRDHQALFGINAIPDGEGTLRVGDELRSLDM